MTKSTIAHPHDGLVRKAGTGYLSKEGIRQIKSKLTNDIFRNEMLHLYEQKSDSRDELVRNAAGNAGTGADHAG